jgi:purine-binding chemotaxis protein CheW
MGVVVDSVSDVLDVEPADIRKPPNLGSSIDTRYMNGMVMVDERVVIVLNSDKLLDYDELAQLQSLSVQATK